jgi:hypothetical protein
MLISVGLVILVVTIVGMLRVLVAGPFILIGVTIIPIVVVIAFVTLMIVVIRVVAIIIVVLRTTGLAGQNKRHNYNGTVLLINTASACNSTTVEKMRNQNISHLPQ